MPVTLVAIACSVIGQPQLCVTRGELRYLGALRAFVFQAEDGIRYLVRSRGLGDVYKRQDEDGSTFANPRVTARVPRVRFIELAKGLSRQASSCLLYTSDAADERSSVDLGGRRII